MAQLIGLISCRLVALATVLAFLATAPSKAQVPPRAADRINNFWGYGTGFVMPNPPDRLYFGATGHIEIVGEELWRIEMFVDPDSALVRHPPRVMTGTARFRVIDSLPIPVLVSINLPDPVTGSPDGAGGHADIIPRSDRVQRELARLARSQATLATGSSWFWDQLIPVRLRSRTEPYFQAVKVTLEFEGASPWQGLKWPPRMRGRQR